MLIRLVHWAVVSSVAWRIAGETWKRFRTVYCTLTLLPTLELAQGTTDTRSVGKASFDRVALPSPASPFCCLHF